MSDYRLHLRPSPIKTTYSASTIGFDSFGVDADPIVGETTESGDLTWGGWVAGSGNLLTSGGILQISNSSGRKVAFVDCGTGNVDISIRGRTSASNQTRVGIYLRGLDEDNHLYFYGRRTNRQLLRKEQGGGGSTLGGGVLQPWVANTWYWLRATIVDDQIECYYQADTGNDNLPVGGWVNIISHTLTPSEMLTFPTTNHLHGIYGRRDFEVSAIHIKAA